MAPKEPPSTVEMKVSSIERRVEVMDLRIEELDRRLTTRLDSLASSVEALTHQVGQMSEGLTRLENLLLGGFTDMREQSRKRDEQIDRLLTLLERLIPERA